jgi:hypothetical protein
MKKVSPLKVGLAFVGIAVGVLAVFGLREATLSTHQPVAPNSRMELIVSGKQRHPEATQTLAEQIEAQLLACRLEVNSDYVLTEENESEVERLPDGTFRTILQPALDQTNEKQFRGCLNDWLLDGVQLDVVRLVELDARSTSS